MKTLVVGSSDIDIFISPSSKDSYIENQRSIAFTLGDKVPINLNAMSLGGNGANVSVGLKKLGVDVSFYTYLGTDPLSAHIQDALKKAEIPVIEHDLRGENTSLSLIFDFSTDRIIFSHHEVRHHTFDSSHVSKFDALYLTSIGNDWKDAYASVVSYVHDNPLALAFSPGSPQLLDLNDTIYEIIAATKILFVNKQEGEKILEKKGQSAQDMKELLQKLSSLGPEIVSVTDGKEGGYAYSKQEFYAISSYDKDSVYADKTGAGDGYASGFFAAHLLGKDLKTSMMWGAVNAHGVIGKVGAEEGLLTPDEIQRLLGARPDFQVQTI